jgi:predicted Rossmann-fold nucleotide-binding protein
MKADEISCGSSPGSISLYANAAKAVGKALAENNIPLIYGGGRRGLMGRLAPSYTCVS